MTVFTVKYNGTEVDNTFGITLSEQINARSVMSFKIPSVLLEDYTTWKDRRFADKIELWSGARLYFTGYVVRVRVTDTLEIECRSATDELSWNYISETSGKFIYDELQVQSSPTDEYLDVLTPEGDDPNYSNDMLNEGDKSYYAIVSDDTLEESSHDYSAYSTSSTTGTTTSGSYTDTAAIDGTFWNTAFDADGEYTYIDFSLANQSGKQIPISAAITKIEIKIGGQLEEDSSVTTVNLKAIVCKSVSSEVQTILNISATAGKNKPFYQEITIVPEDSEDYVEKGATYYQNFGIKFKVSPIGGVVSCHTNIDYAVCTIHYSTATFERINREIRDTLYDAVLGTQLILENDDKTAGYDLSGKGIAPGDSVKISIKVDDGMNKCNTSSVPVLLNDGDGIDAGFYQDYNMITALDLLRQICDQFNHIWYEDLTDNVLKIKTIKESDIAAATDTFSTSSDPPELITDLTSEDNEYGGVIVQYRDGVTPIVYPSGGSSNPRVKLIQADNINTLTEAINYASLWAEYYDTPHPSVNLKWKYGTNIILRIGKKYNITLKKLASGTISDYSLTNLICRRIIISTENNQNDRIISAYFGGGNTPPDEKMGMKIAEIERTARISRAVDTNRLNRSISRHGDLLGILGNSDGYHVSSETYNAISSDGTNLEFSEDLLPDADNTLDIGSSAKRLAKIYTYSQSNSTNIDTPYLRSPTDSTRIRIKAGARVFFRNYEDTAWQDVEMGVLYTNCRKLPDDKCNWKEELFSKYPYLQGPSHELNADDGGSIDVGLVARLALKKAEELEKLCYSKLSLLLSQQKKIMKELKME